MTLNKAAEVLEAGGIIVYPTDTVYGLAVDATNTKAVDRLYKLKGRNFNKPTHVIIPNTAWLRKIVKLNKPALKLMNKFLPGPLTIVLPLKAKGKSWQKLSAGTKSLGIRLPKYKMALDLVKKFGKPITTTSANLSGESNCYTIIAVQKQFAKAKIKPDFYIDGGKLKKNKPSTVVSLLKDVKILREGPIKEIEIRNALK